VRHVLRRADFRRLLGTRLLSQFGDGVFQAAVAGTVLFDPQRAADPLAVAAGFAVLLLPYSAIGPFAGVWLDRWSRRSVLLRANVVRAVLVALAAALVAGGIAGVPFYLAGLAVFSVTRFVLAALSAALPHTTDAPLLVSANALSTTSGALAGVVGGGMALSLVRLVGEGDSGYAALALAAAVPYVLAAAVVARFPRAALGPDSPAGSERLTARQVVTGMGAGARHVWARRPAAVALGVICVHRVCFGVLTLMTLLLYRNTFTGHGGLFPGRLTGLSEILAAGALGTLLAAAVTPRVVRRIGKARWISVALAGAGAVELGLGLPFLPSTTVIATVALAFVGQAVKICVDTTLQESVEDDYRGRVFSVYDTLFNITYVAALLLAAVLLPTSGVSSAMLVAVAGLYLLTAAAQLQRSRRSGGGEAGFPAL
jgi:MFS family permease